MTRTELEALVRLLGWLRALLAAGRPLPEGLAGLAARLRGQDRARAERLAAELAQGVPVSQALGSEPPLVGALVRAGEAGGQLREAVDGLAEHYETQLRLDREMASSVLYPKIAFLVMVTILLPTLAWVNQQIAPPNDAFGMGTTPFARMLDFFVWVMLAPFSHGIVVCLAIDVAAVLLLFGGLAPLDRLTGKFARRLSSGKTRRAALGAALARGLALLTGAGVPAGEALRMLSGCTTDADARAELAAAARRAESGEPLSVALAGTTALPPAFGWFLELGETGPSLPAALHDAAKFFAQEASDRASLVAAGVQPVLLLALTAAFLPSGAVLARLVQMVGAMGAI